MINYFTEDISFKFLNKRKCSQWIRAAIIEESATNSKKPGDFSIVFCSDEYILKMNKQYLKHDYYTDIITFDNSHDNKVSADIFISIETVKSNAIIYNQSFLTEIHRVIIHGILHLLNYDDQTIDQKLKMTEREEHYLNKYFSV